MTDSINKDDLRVVLDKGRYRLVDHEGTVIEEASRFLSAVEARGLSPLTVRAYAYDLLDLYRWLEGRHESEAKCVEQLEQSDLLDFVRLQREKNAQPTSINHRLTVAGVLYRFLTGEQMKAARGVILPTPYYKGRGKDRNLGIHRVNNPCYRALRVKTPRKLVEPLTAEQARLLISIFKKKYRDITIAYLMLLCGLRSQEVLTIKVQDLNFVDNRLRVLGKGNKERVLPLSTLLVDSLRNYLRLERPSVCRTNSLFVILKGKRRGYPMTKDGLRSLFRYRRRNENLNNANPHRLRHTFGTDMARAGMRLSTLQKLMGHADSTMTVKYINLSMSDIAAEFHRAIEQIQNRYNNDEK